MIATEAISRAVVTGRFTNEDPHRLFDRVADISAYPEMIDVVDAVRILEASGDRRTAAWEIRLRGSVLQWTETAMFDRQALTISFQQLDGDLDVFEGRWAVERGEEITVCVSVDFRIGIPLMAHMLQPIALEALSDSLAAILTGVGAVSVERNEGVSSDELASDR